MNNNKVIVLGAGVIGLTTALLLQKEGFEVTVVADHFPGTYHADYTSPWAGAHWRSVAANEDKRHKEYDRIAYTKFLELARGELKHILKVVPNLEYHEIKEDNCDEPWFKNFAEKFYKVEKSKLPEGYVCGFGYDAVCIDSPKYLKWLVEQIKVYGGKLHKYHVNHIYEAFEIDSIQSDIVINCTGIGSRTLGGVTDHDVFPTRGQTVLVNAPEINYTVAGIYKDGITYVIPRGDGTVILGGTIQEHNYQVQPDEFTAKDILERCQKLTGGLGPYNVISHNVGFRPTRKGGVRSEIEKINLNSRKNLILCHQYGHGGFGYQSSWGSALNTIKLLKDYIKSNPVNKIPSSKL